MFSSIPGLYPLEASDIPPNPKRLQTILNRLLGVWVGGGDGQSKITPFEGCWRALTVRQIGQWVT